MTVEKLAAEVRDAVDESIWMSGASTRISRPHEMRTLEAACGIHSFVPDEMTVSCGAGTSVDELLEVLGSRGQYINLPRRRSGSGTVGGALAFAEGDIMRLGRGSVRDVLLQADFVDGRGTIIRAGGPTVKNVSGFDLCRLLVGSCGRIGFISDVILRTRPVPLAHTWFEISDCGRDQISRIMRAVHKPTSVLWNGQNVQLCLEGHPSDLEEDRIHLEGLLGRTLWEREAPDLDDFPHQWIRKHSEIEEILELSPDRCIAEIGTGVIHHADREENESIDPTVLRVEDRILSEFDPQDRMNGGTAVWGTSHRRRPLKTMGANR